MIEIDKGLLGEILGEEVNETIILEGSILKYSYRYLGYAEINIYELVHKNLKQWAKLKNVFDIIDWSEEPEQIFKKVEKIRNEIN